MRNKLLYAPLPYRPAIAVQEEMSRVIVATDCQVVLDRSQSFLRQRYGTRRLSFALIITVASILCAVLLYLPAVHRPLGCGQGSQRERDRLHIGGALSHGGAVKNHELKAKHHRCG